jgi:hypothetical protein
VNDFVRLCGVADLQMKQAVVSSARTILRYAMLFFACPTFAEFDQPLRLDRQLDDLKSAQRYTFDAHYKCHARKLTHYDRHHRLGLRRRRGIDGVVVC